MKSEFKKDDCVTLHIEDIGTGGEGIGKADGFTFFVKDAIVGDVCNVASLTRRLMPLADF